MEILISLLALFCSLIALGIAVKSNKLAKAISNLEFDEKLAVMAAHIEKLNKTDYSVALLETIRNDFNAVSNIKDYASQEKKTRLINDYIIKIIEKSLENNLDSGMVIALNDIIRTALEYKINVAGLSQQKDKIRNI